MAKNRLLRSGDAARIPIPTADNITRKFVIYKPTAITFPRIIFDFEKDVVINPVILSSTQLKASTEIRTVGTQHGQTERLNSTMLRLVCEYFQIINFNMPSFHEKEIRAPKNKKKCRSVNVVAVNVSFL